MTAELGTHLAGAAADPAAVFRRAIVEGIKNGQDVGQLLRSLLGQANLPPEHRELVEIFLDTQQSAEAALVDEPEPDAEFDALHRELTDLREANDTVAAALGACRICWGGDSSCAVCHGQGCAGYRAPEAALFNELVLPAVRRVRALRAEAAARPPIRPARL